MARLILLVILSCVTLLGCSRKEEKINIGFMGTLSGRYAELGQATLHGVMLAVEDSGAADKVNLVVKDDFGKAGEATKLISEFASSGIKYLIGPGISSVATEVVPLLESHEMYMISPTASTSELAGKKDNFFRTMPYNSYKQADVIATYLLKRLDVKEAVIIYDSRNASYSNDIVKKFTEAFLKEGGEIRDVRPFDPDSGESLGALLEKDKGNPPQMYYVIGSSMDTSLMIWQIRKQGFSSRVLIRKWAASNDFYRLGGEAVEGVMLFDFYIDKSTPAYLAFEEKYKNRFQKEPGWMSVYGYEAAKMLVDALGDLRSGRGFEQSIAASSKKIQLLKDLEFDEFGDAYLPLHYFIIHHGEMVYQGPAE